MARKEINIFNIAFVDLLSGALGAVIILYIIVPKVTLEEVEQLETIQQLNVEVDQIGGMIAQLENSVDKSIVREIQEQLEKVQATVAELTDQVQDLQQREKQCDDERQALREEVRILEELSRNAKGKIKELTEKIEDLERQLAKCEEERRAVQERAERAEAAAREAQEQVEEITQKLQDCENELREKNFMVVSIKWQTENQDVDLFVVDPSGAKFYYGEVNHSNRPGTLSADTKVGPGVEVFEILNPPAGRYKLYVNLYTRQGNNNIARNPASPEVTGRVFYSKGAKLLPTVTLENERETSDVDQMTLLMTVNVRNDGSFSFE